MTTGPWQGVGREGMSRQADTEGVTREMNTGRG